MSGRPTYARYITDVRRTNHLPSVAELRPTRPRTLPDKTDTTPTYNRQTTDNLSGRDLSNMFERSLPDKFVCPNINQHQTDKTESIPTVNRSLPKFEDFCRFEVGFVSVWPVWLGFERSQEICLGGWQPVGFNIKTVFPRYGDSHVKDKTVVRPSYLWHGDLYTVKTTSLYWDGRQIISMFVFY